MVCEEHAEVVTDIPPDVVDLASLQGMVLVVLEETALDRMAEVYLQNLLVAGLYNVKSVESIIL